MKNETTYVSGGVGFLDLLGIVFIVLKLCGVISWSWLWVTAPIWMPLAIGGVILVIAFIFYIIGMIFNN